MAAGNPINNCLVTKLTASIDSEMPRLGEFIVEFDPITNPQNKDMYICVSYAETSPGAADYSGYVRLLTEGTLIYYSSAVPSGADAGTQLDISDNRTYCIIVPNGGKIAIGNKYYLKSFSPFSYYATETLGFGNGRLPHKKFNAADLVYCTNLETLSLQNTTVVGTFDLSLLSKLKEVGLSNSTAVINAEMFLENFNITSLQLLGSTITGEFAPVFDNWVTKLAGTYKKMKPFSLKNTDATVDGTHYTTNIDYVEFRTDGTWEVVMPS